jgi:hypothetical protein
LERSKKQCNNCKGKNLNYHIYYTTCMKDLMIMVKS